MEHGKYIIVKERGHLVAILFDPLIEHNTFLKCYSKDQIISAGFFTVAMSIDVFGQSTTLNLRASEDDVPLIRKVLM